MISILTTFYLAQWEEYYTGTLTLGYVGVTEGQLSAIAIYLTTAYFGVSFWTTELHLFGWKLTYGCIPMFITIASVIPTALSNFKEVIQHHLKGSGVVGIGIAFWKAVPVFIYSYAFLAWGLKSDIYFNHPHLFIITYGFLVSNLVGRIVLHRVCHENFQPIQYLLFPLIAVPFVISTQWEHPFLFVYGVVAVASYLHFALSVINDLCATLNIYCLHLGKKLD